MVYIYPRVLKQNCFFWHSLGDTIKHAHEGVAQQPRQAAAGISLDIDFGGLKMENKMLKGGVFSLRGKPLEGLGQADGANRSQIASGLAVLALFIGPKHGIYISTSFKTKLFLLAFAGGYNKACS